MKYSSDHTRIRKPAVAGKFYPGSGDALNGQIKNIHDEEMEGIDSNLAIQKVIGGIVPHAGYMYSGYEAVHFFDIISRTGETYDTIIILNPNHSGMGEPIALDINNSWESPLGIVDLDRDFMDEVAFPESAIAHQYEHSAEVMLPFLQYFLKYPFKIVPVSIAIQSFTNSRSIAEAIFHANSKLKRNLIVIASSDFSHYVRPEVGEKKDNLVLKEILDLNSEQVLQTVKEHNISVCGYGPIMALMEYARLVADEPLIKVLRRGHSGEIIPSAEVVDYVTILFYTQNGSK
ncbi:MAG: AmmeMemoRadiSam system protein B [Bacteroidales bacterium]|nr:MAG: AmmeMemoRadiSam system protein B [Bacteroidales bacterium]